MEELYEMVRSPVFWAGSVLTGILVNIISHYGQKLLEKYGGKFYDFQRKRNAAAKEHRRKLLLALDTSLDLRISAWVASLLDYVHFTLSAMLVFFVLSVRDEVPPLALYLLLLIAIASVLQSAMNLTWHEGLIKGTYRLKGMWLGDLRKNPEAVDAFLASHHNPAVPTEPPYEG